jgi:diguanylate cyclase (GGDEF)-like protein
MKVMIASSTPLSATRRRMAAATAPGADLADGPGGLREFLRRVDARLQPDRFTRPEGPGGGVALLCLGVDQMEVVESGLGPVCGQALLHAVERRIAGTPGAGDVASLGGGRFAVLLPSASGPRGAVAAVERLQERVAAPFRVGTHEVYVTLSAGVATSGGEHRPAEDLLRDARAALHQATLRGRGTCRLFEAAMQTRALHSLDLEAALRRAVLGHEFALYYQPIVCLESGRIRGFEALLRWNRPGAGTLPPSAFLALAESSGQVVPIGRWALRQACEQVRRWRALPGADQGLTVNVNLSTRQLLHPGIVADVEDALAAAGLPGNALRLELTESALMESGEAAVETLCRLKALGVTLCIDDFGVGYSSLAYLHRFPVDVLKVDRSFIVRLGADGESDGIVSAIVALAHGLGMLVVPEGVETDDQLRRVRALECGSAQGYLFSPPLPAEQAQALLLADRRW